MTTPYECRDETKEDVTWALWLSQCERLIGRDLQSIEAHSDLFDLYSDGCTPQEAIDESLAQNLPN